MAVVGKPVRVNLELVKETVDRLLQERGLTEKWLYEKIDMSKNGYREMWVRASVKATAMQDIADALRLTLEELLTGGPKAPGTMAAEGSAPYGQHLYLEQRVDQLEQRLKDLERRK